MMVKSRKTNYSSRRYTTTHIWGKRHNNSNSPTKTRTFAYIQLPDFLTYLCFVILFLLSFVQLNLRFPISDFFCWYFYFSTLTSIVSIDDDKNCWHLMIFFSKLSNFKVPSSGLVVSVAATLTISIAIAIRPTPEGTQAKILSQKLLR